MGVFGFVSPFLFMGLPDKVISEMVACTDAYGGFLVFLTLVSHFNNFLFFVF